MRKLKGLLGIIVASFVLVHAGGFALADDKGNNGTLKVIDQRDPAMDMDNDPHVCTFKLAGFKFDGNSTGTWSIEKQAPSGSGQVSSGSFNADASGTWDTAWMSLPDGHYKASAKQNGSVGGDKQKVFWVRCNQSAPTPTPTPGALSSNGPTPTPSPTQSAAGQPASMTGTGSQSKGTKSGTGSKSKAAGSASGTGSVSANGSIGSTHGEQGATATPSPTPTATPGSQGFVHIPSSNANNGQSGNANNGGSANTGNNAQSGNAANNGSQGAQGVTNMPQNAAGAQGMTNVPQNAAGAQGFSNLPSTSSEGAGPLSAVGALLVAFGAFLLRRPGRQTR